MPETIESLLEQNKQLEKYNHQLQRTLNEVVTEKIELLRKYEEIRNNYLRLKAELGTTRHQNSLLDREILCLYSGEANLLTEISDLKEQLHRASAGLPLQQITFHLKQALALLGE